MSTSRSRSADQSSSRQSRQPRRRGGRLSSSSSQSSRQKYYVVNASNYLTENCQFYPEDLRNSIPLEITDKNFRKFKPYTESDALELIDSNTNDLTRSIINLNRRLSHLFHVRNGFMFYSLTTLTRGINLQFWTHIQLYEYFYKLLCKLTGQTDIRLEDLPSEIADRFYVLRYDISSDTDRRILVSTLYPEFTLRPQSTNSLGHTYRTITLTSKRNEPKVIRIWNRNPALYRAILDYYGLYAHRLYDVIKDILLPTLKRNRRLDRPRAIRDNTAKYTVDGGYRYVFRVIALRIGTSEITPGYQNITVDSYRKLTHLDIKPMIKTAVMSTVGSRLYGPRAAEFGRDGVFDNLVEDLEISRLYGTVDSNPYIRNRIYQNGKLKIKLEPNKPAPPLLPASYVLDLSVSGRPERFLLGGDVVNIGIRLNNVDESILGARPADQWSNSDGTLTL